MIYEWRTPLNLVAKAYFAWRRNAVVEMGGEAGGDSNLGSGVHVGAQNRPTEANGSR